ncbi:MAG: hypothetical protein Q8R25_03255 [bacterium]|nr:hypothetical protein [bacterium]
MRALARIFISWLPLAIAITGLCFLVYGTVQQNYRQSLNDPQIQMAEDIGHLLGMGTEYTVAIPANKVDIAGSLAPWVNVYDGEGNPFVGNGYLDEVLGKPPYGVLQDGNRVTWQPNTGARQAIVVYEVPRMESSLYVVVGRSMREVEEREGQLSGFVFLAWITMLGTTFLAKAFARYFS